MTYKVVELFDSIEGEGKRAGKPATFVRLAGCNLRCTYCDTTYAFGNEFEEIPLQNILAHIKKRLYRRVTLTGGEPLATPGVEVLIHEMLLIGCEVNIETNGSVDISPLFQHLQNVNCNPGQNLFFTMDYKLPASGVSDKMHLPNFPKLCPWDVLKFVVGSEEDVTYMQSYIKTLTSTPQIYIGAVHGQYNLQTLVQTILETPELANATLQLQLHKIIWDASERGV